MPFVVLAVAAVYVVGGLGLFGSRRGVSASKQTTAALPDAGPLRGATLDVTIGRLQQRVKSVPQDFVAWASLDLAYVEQAKVSVDPIYYPKAQVVLERSLSINIADNYAAAAGMSTLAAARHDFTTAKSWAEKGLKINPANATLYGALDDAETQLGNYPAAFAATQRMVDLAPNSASLSRVSYTWELRGNVELARTYMQRALEDANGPAGRAFALYYLGELALNQGNPAGAMHQYRAGLAADASYAPNLEGIAKAEAALGQTAAALSDFAQVTNRVPQPTYLIEYGELLESVGRKAEAEMQYSVFEAEQRLFEANGATGDVDPTLFYADHGQPKRALLFGERAIKKRSFLEMDDAYAWALHVNGRDAEALDWSAKALHVGTRSALFHYHSGMIQKALGHHKEARAALTTALQLNSHFNPLAAPLAQRALAELGPGMQPSFVSA